MQLTKPTIENKKAALDFRQAFFDIGEYIIHGDNCLDEAETYEDWLVWLDDIKAGKHDYYLPSSTFFAVVDDNIVGIVDIRHSLNDFLINVGGHIGYSVHPNERLKGYTIEILRLALEKCQQMEINPVLITCDKDNIGSQKTIINNGGVLENEFIDENGKITLRFWVNVVN